MPHSVDTSEQDVLFPGKADGLPDRGVSPSDEFRAANPDFVEPAVRDRIVDPATRRRAAQTAHVGGGIAAVMRGDLQLEAWGGPAPAEVERKIMPPRRKRAPAGKTRGDSEADIVPPIYFSDAVLLDANQQQLNSEQARLVKDQLNQTPVPPDPDEGTYEWFLGLATQNPYRTQIESSANLSQVIPGTNTA